MKKNAVPRTEWYGGFTPLIIILVVAVLGMVVYFAYNNYFAKPQVLLVSSPSPSATSNPMANWKTYSGIITYGGGQESYNISFSYPSGLETASSGPYEVVLNKRDPKSLMNDTRLLVVSSFDNFYEYRNVDKSQPIQKWFTEIFVRTNPNIKFDALPFKEKTTSSGKQYLDFSDFPNEYPVNLFPHIQYYIPVNNSSVLVTEDSNGYLSPDTIDRILDTLTIHKN